MGKIRIRNNGKIRIVFQTAFQSNAFQNNAFQISGVPPSPITDTHDGFTPEEIRRAKRLDKKIRERELALIKAKRTDDEARKQSFRNLIDPKKVVQKQENKLQSIQEVKADKPSVDTQELERSIRYLEKQRENLVKAVAHRQEALRLRTEYLILEAKRLAELDDEETILLLM